MAMTVSGSRKPVKDSRNTAVTVQKECRCCCSTTSGATSKRTTVKQTNTICNGKAKAHTACSSSNKTKTIPYTDIESEYIRNLQQQIDYLEIENGYLREQVGDDMGAIAIDSSALPPRRPTGHGEGRPAGHEAGGPLRRPVDAQPMPDHGPSGGGVRMEERMRSLIEAHEREKSVLKSEIVELHKRLDEVRPEISRREVELADVKTQLHEAQQKLRGMEQEVDLSILQEHQKSGEQAFRFRIEEELRTEVEKSITNIQRIEYSLSEERTNSDRLREEIDHLERRLREKEMELQLEKQLALEQREARPQTIVRTEEHHSEILALKQRETELKDKLYKVQELLEREEFKSAQLQKQLDGSSTDHEVARQSQLRLQNQIDELERLSRSISEENRGLRREKMDLEETLNGVKSSAEERERNERLLEARVREADDRYERLLKKFNEEHALFEERNAEFEKLGCRVKQLARQEHQHY